MLVGIPLDVESFWSVETKVYEVICEPDHLKNFKKFTPPVGDETVKYRMVACGEQHVLAVSI